MRHEVIVLPKTGVELELYLMDNRAVEEERRRPLALIFRRRTRGDAYRTEMAGDAPGSSLPS